MAEYQKGEQYPQGIYAGERITEDRTKGEHVFIDADGNETAAEQFDLPLPTHLAEEQPNG